MCLDGLRDVVVAVGNTLITADFGVLALTLLHQGLQLSVVTLRHGLGLHLHDQVAASPLDARADVDDGLLQPADTRALVYAGVGEDVERRRDQLDLDLCLLSVLLLGLAKRGLDGVDTLVSKARDLDIGSDLGGLGCEALADV